MSDKSPFRLYNVNVVVTAEFHNPSILNPDFLKRHKIVPQDWETTETVTTPAVSTAAFTNGIKIVVEPSKMTVAETKIGNFGQKTHVHGVAERYVRRLPHVPYKAVGLNCQLSMVKGDPSHWVKSRFLKPGKWLSGKPVVRDVSLKLRLKTNTGDCNLTLEAGKIQPLGGEAEEAVLISSNFHHEGPFDVNGIKAIFRTWPDQEKFLHSTLVKLLTRQLR